MAPQPRVIQPGVVLRNERVCREHYRLVFELAVFPPSAPGQFLHINPVQPAASAYRVFDRQSESIGDRWRFDCRHPMLRRAFSIAGRRTSGDRQELDVIYRVVGTATTWMATLTPGDEVSVLGPLGNAFPIVEGKARAWLVAGGVGLPPMLYLAEALTRANMATTAFCGAQTADLLALTLDAPSVSRPDNSGTTATMSAAEFSACGVPVVISTDDGSVGFAGHIGAALDAYHGSNTGCPDDLVIYTCGPERMMHFVSTFCRSRGIDCYVCMERAMACGTGTCQSCVVPIADDTNASAWRYALCCAEGPVFDARQVVWSPANAG